jgi:Flp pilus assembly protein TadB
MDVIDDPLFLVMMSVGIGLLLSGILIMWKMVRFKV